MTWTRGRGFGYRKLQSKPEEEWQALAWESERGIEPDIAVNNNAETNI